MQPILAESAPHRGRAVAFAAALAVVAALAIPSFTRPHHRDPHHRLQMHGRCSHPPGILFR